MLIRKPKQQETEKIVRLLQASLGEGLLKKSTNVWNFKHIENPFGESHVLVGEENSDLIGVRALMQWRWQLADKVWTAYRAVDTATHPNYQGKGIFTKLTLQALHDVQQLSESFVFNTPNEKSRPGYLKMGWQPVGKIRVALIPVFFYLKHWFGTNPFTENRISEEQLEQLCQLHNKKLHSLHVLFTPKSVSYLKWRYKINPMQPYTIISTPDWYLAMYVKKHKYFAELRVVEILGELTDTNHKQVQKAIIEHALKNRCLLVTTTNKDIFRLRIFGDYGPVLTFKSLTSSQEFDEKALRIQNWNYSLGDLELF